MAHSSKKTLRRRRRSIEVYDGKHALDLATAQTYSENVFLFVPNLIGRAFFLPSVFHVCLTMSCFCVGYTRIILAGLSLHFMSYHPHYCTILYGISCLLDAVDGHAARALGQSSKFGAVLDMVTDRSVFPDKLFPFDSIFYQVYNFLFIMLFIIRLPSLCNSIPISHHTWL